MEEQLEKRLQNIEARLSKIEQANYSSLESEQIKQPEVSEPSTPELAIEKKSNAFISWLKKDWLMKIGAFLLILGLGWFVTYAFVNNWIGPAGRISLGIIAGLAVLVVGFWQIPKRSSAGQVLVSTGGITMLLTLFAARSVYDFFTPASAMAMMSVVVIALAVISVFHNKKSIAYLALIGGAFVPFLIDSDTKNYTSLLYYVLALDIGVLVVLALRSWRGLILCGLAVTGLYSFFFNEIVGDKTIWIFMGIFFILFFTAIASAIMKTKKASIMDLIATGLNGILFLIWVSEFVPDNWQSIVLSIVILLFIGVSFALYKIGNLNKPLYINSGLAILFLGTATAFELSGSTLVIAYALEIFALIFLAYYVLQNKKVAQVLSPLQAIPVLMALNHITYRQWRGEDLFNEHFFVLLFVIFSTAGTAFLLNNFKQQKTDIVLTRIYSLTACAYSFILIWLVALNIFESKNTAHGVSLVIYTICGIGLVFASAYKKVNFNKIIGYIILAGVILRLLAVEVWTMPLSGRVITFIVIGLLLISTAFFEKKITKN